MQEILKTKELHLADQVRMWYSFQKQTDPNGSQWLVRQIKDGRVFLWRPYVSHADFSSTSGVIPYVGIEEMTVDVMDSLEWVLIRRTELQ